MSKILKNTQINVGIPFQIKTPLNFNTIKKIEPDETITEKELKISAKSINQELERELIKAKEEASVIVREAELEAGKILVRANEEIDSIRNEAHEEGFRQGYNEGFDTGHNEGKQSYEGMLIELSQLKDQMDNEYRQLVIEAEQDIVEIILDVARKVISEEARVNKENVLMLVQKALLKCNNRDKVVIRVSAEDEPFLNENRDRLAAAAEGIGDLEIKTDKALQPGSCCIDTTFGSIDAGIDTQLDGIAEAFKELLLQYSGQDQN